MTATDNYEDEDERLNRLQEFAGTNDGPSRRDLVEVGAANLLQSMDRVFGAQKVAVRRQPDAEIKKELKVMAAAAGEEWYYRFPARSKVKNETTGKEEWVTTYIEGPSIKLTDDLARIYGNCDLDTRSMDMGDSWLFMSRFIDLQTGYSRTRPYQQRKGQKTIKGDPGRALDIAYQIGCSKAERNVVVHALGHFANYAFEEARNSLVEKIGKKLPEWREGVVKKLREQGIDKARVERVIGRTADAWLAPDIASVIASMKAISDGMATWDDSFPPLVTVAAETGEKIDKEIGEVTNEPAKSNAKQADTKPTSLDEFAGDDDVDRANRAGIKPGETTILDDIVNGQVGEPPREGQKMGPGEDNLGLKTPANEQEYLAYFEAVFPLHSATDVAGWFTAKAEKQLRNACKVSEKTRDALKARVDAKAAGK